MHEYKLDKALWNILRNLTNAQKYSCAIFASREVFDAYLNSSIKRNSRLKVLEIIADCDNLHNCPYITVRDIAHEYAHAAHVIAHISFDLDAHYAANIAHTYADHMYFDSSLMPDDSF